MSAHLDTVRRFLDAARRHDFDAVLGCVTDDIEYYFHMGSKPVLGKEKMRKFLRNYTAAYEAREQRILHWAEADELLLLEGYEELHDRKLDRIIRQPFMQAYEFRDGRIAKLRDYYEPANLRPPAASGHAAGPS